MTAKFRLPFPQRTKKGQLRALASVCRSLGGRLAVVSQRAFDVLFESDNLDDREEGDGLSTSPFTHAHGQHWRKKIVYAVHKREQIGVIIHEMGHVFAAKHVPYHASHHSCRECHEWNWLGWEIALARKVGAARTWSRHNANYETGEAGGGQWGKLSAEQRRVIVANRLAHARKLGIVDVDGNPRSVR